LEEAGARIVEIGDADETLDFDLEGSVNDNTAAVFFFENIAFKRAEMSLEKVINIAHRRNIPVVVDAAAQLPPRSNFWKYTSMGADLAIFSGGKTLCGPQDSGIILGKTEYIELCRKFGAPEHGVCRSSKTSRESMIGLLSALEQFMEKDEAEEYSILKKRLVPLATMLETLENVRVEYVEYGPVGQNYPRLFAFFNDSEEAAFLTQAMFDRGIYIGYEKNAGAVYFSPLNLIDTEVLTVGNAVLEILQRGK